MHTRKPDEHKVLILCPYKEQVQMAQIILKKESEELGKAINDENRRKSTEKDRCDAFGKCTRKLRYTRTMY